MNIDFFKFFKNVISTAGNLFSFGRLSALVFCFVLFFTSCADFEEVSISSIENFKITNLTQKGAEAEITVRIKNPNKVAFTVYKSNFDLMINGINAGKAHLNKKVRIKPQSEETYTFKIKSDFSNLSASDLPQLMSMVMSKNVKVGLKGNLKAGKLFVRKSYPVDLNQRVPLGGKN